LQNRQALRFGNPVFWIYRLPFLRIDDFLNTFRRQRG
jgi:hypothetical protein